MRDHSEDGIVRATAADGKTPVYNIPGSPLMVCAIDFNRLVAEVERLKQAHEINADTLNAMQVEIDDWKARALKAEQVGEPTTEQLAVLFTKESGGPNPYYRCHNCGKTEPGLQEYLAAHWKICVTPQPAAQRLAGREQAIEECAAECLVLHANGNYKHDTREDCHDAIRALAASPQEQT